MWGWAFRSHVPKGPFIVIICRTVPYNQEIKAQTFWESTAGICVINKLSICQVMGQGIKQVVLKNADFKDFEPLLIFIATLYRILTSLQINNSPLTDQELARVMGSRFLWFWESYLTDYMRQQLQNPAPR
jgi:hypothetical protein